MPKISDERREARRHQILEAARACLQEHGLEAVSMEMIIARSGLSTGAVYGYFKGKDEIINAAVTDGTAELATYLVPLLSAPEPPPLPELMGQVLGAIEEFGERRDGIDRLLVSLHGWSHSQTDPALRDSARAAYVRLRALLADTVKRGQAAGTFPAGADADETAELLTSVCLGFVAQRALAGDASVRAHAAALTALGVAVRGTALPAAVRCAGPGHPPRARRRRVNSGRTAPARGSPPARGRAALPRAG